jgi:hypothetical protein
MSKMYADDRACCPLLKGAQIRPSCDLSTRRIKIGDLRLVTTQGMSRVHILLSDKSEVVKDSSV